MRSFTIYTLENAPEASKPALSDLKEAFGFIPNVAGAMAGSPVLLTCLAQLFKNVHDGSFSERQIQVLLLTNAVANAADWAVGFHSFLALGQGVSVSDVDAIRTGKRPSTQGDAALSRLAQALISQRGRLDEEDVRNFLEAGFDQRHLLEVIAVIAASTITNYTVNVTRPPLEPPFDRHTWTRG